MENKNILFELIKSEQYDKFISIIKKNNIDVNEYDETNTYYVQYAIIYRQKNILSLLISKGCKLDIIDNDGRSLLYIPIKYNYLEIVKLLIEFSHINIGIPLLEIQDKYLQSPIHYSIIFNKYNILDIILDKKCNLNLKDSEGNTPLHLLINNINNNTITYIKKLLDSNSNINSINNINQNVLHLGVDKNNFEICKLLISYNSNINTKNNYNHYTPIFISTNNNNLELCNLLIENNSNVNDQDIYGNTILNISIINKFNQLITLYYNIVDVNINNISGKNTILLFFNNNYDLGSLNDFHFKEILTKSKVNIQNNIGKTLWHYLTQDDIWENYYDILLYKKNKIFIQDNEGITPFDTINNLFKNKLNKFINLISESYYNYIITYPNNNYIIKLNTTNKNNCIKKIKNIIQNNKISFPQILKTYVNIDVNNTDFTSYNGSIIDILSGLLYLKNTYKNVSTSLTGNFYENTKLQDYYLSSGILINKDFLNIEIIWSFQQLFVPTTFYAFLNDFLNDNTKEYLVIPIGIQLSNGSHSNILLYIKSSNSLERFEPYGKDYPTNFNYNDINLDNHIKKLFLNNENYNNNDNFIYYNPYSYEPKIGLQILDSIEFTTEKYIGDPDGFCSAWCIWYIYMRIKYINIERNNIINSLINNIRSNKYSFRSVIRSFVKEITDVRDNLFTQVNLNINKWINNNYSDDEWIKLIEIIKKEIN